MKDYKIICITQIYNELEKGNLKRFVKYVLPLCDALVVYDDASTDGSYEYMKKVTPYVIRGKKNNFADEITHKKLLLEKAKELAGDFILHVDADEVLSTEDPDVLQKLAKMCIHRNIDGLRFKKINLWRSHTWKRTDSLFDIGWFVHFWRITPQTKYGSIKKGLHQNPFPPTVKHLRKSTDVAVLHYGFANEKNLAFKYLTYKSFGQRGYILLDRLISEETLTLKRVPEKLFPDGLYEVNEPKSKRKFFSESLAFVEKYKERFEEYRPYTSHQIKKHVPLVTIVTPTYNRARLLEITAESILSQDYPNIEYIIIDDGSKDATKEVVTKLKNKYTKRKIIYIQQKNTGETAAVNKGFSLATGEYIAVVSSDDPLLPGCVDELVEYLEDHPKVIAIYPDWEMIDERGKVLQTVYPEDFTYVKMLKEHYCIPGPGSFFRRKALELTGGRTKEFKYLADFAFWLKLGMYGEMYHYPKVLASFRVHSGSQGIYAKGDYMASEHKKLVEWVFADRDLPKKAKDTKETALASAYFHAANESINISSKVRYYLDSFVADPRVFFSKVFYELIKLKHRLGYDFSLGNA